MRQHEAIQVYWYIADDSQAGSAPDLNLLGDDERQRYGELKRPELAARFLFRRLLLRKLLARHCDVPLSQVTLVAGPNGKPALAASETKVHFNASHTDGFGVIAIATQGPIGIDVEQVRPIDVAAFSQRILSPQERLEFSIVEEAERLPAMFRYWTAKEAVIKALGMGLNLNQLSQISNSDKSRSADWRPVVFDGGLGSDAALFVKTQPMPAPASRTLIVSICCGDKSEIRFASAVEAVGG